MAENLSQSGQKVDLTKYVIGQKIMLEKPRSLDVDPTVEDRLINEPRLQTEAIRNDKTYREGEFVILKDDPHAQT